MMKKKESENIIAFYFFASVSIFLTDLKYICKKTTAYEF